MLQWLASKLHTPVTLDDIAQRAGMSGRSLGRRFREQTGATPLQWLLRACVQRSQQLLETTNDLVERIASRAGFGSVAAFASTFGASWRPARRPTGARFGARPCPARRPTTAAQRDGPDAALARFR